MVSIHVFSTFKNIDHAPFIWRIHFFFWINCHAVQPDESLTRNFARHVGSFERGAFYILCHSLQNTLYDYDF